MSTRSTNTPATDASFELLGRIAVEPDSEERYPSGTVVIPADTPDASVVIARTIDGRRPLALVFADGATLVTRPPDVAGFPFFARAALRLAESWDRRRSRAVRLPPEWVTEFRAAPGKTPRAVTWRAE